MWKATNSSGACVFNFVALRISERQSAGVGGMVMCGNLSVHLTLKSESVIGGLKILQKLRICGTKPIF